MKAQLVKNPFPETGLIGSKWTALSPVARDRHFVVTGWADTPTDCDNTPDCVTLEAVSTGRTHTVLWRALRRGSAWRLGWL